MREGFNCPHCGVRLYTQSKPEIDYDYFDWQPVKYPDGTIFECSFCKNRYNQGYLRWEPNPVIGSATPWWHKTTFLCLDCAKKYNITVN